MSPAKDLSEPLVKRAQGAILGALVGDAAGAHVEFESFVSPALAAKAMSLPGGGPFQLAPGQVTDDGELTMCLLRALATGDDFDLERIARSYADWFLSHPFDRGSTTSASIGCIGSVKIRNLAEEQGYARTMTEAAHQACRSSQANGSLMRATPLGVRGYLLPDAELERWASLDSGLSHPSAPCRQAVAAYSIAIAELLRTGGDRDRAFARAENWAREQAGPEVRAWFADARAGDDTPFGPQIGWVRYAFTHAFAHLNSGSSYSQAITAIIAGTGDTDTNAAIAGGLIGAAVGLDGIPARMVETVLNCETAAGSHPRPDFLHPRHAPRLVEKLLTHAAAGPA